MFCAAIFPVTPQHLSGAYITYSYVIMSAPSRMGDENIKPRRGRPRGKRKRNRGFSTDKHGARKRLKDVRNLQSLTVGRSSGKPSPIIEKLVDVPNTEALAKVDDSLLAQVFRVANKLNGEGPPGLSLYGEINRGGLKKIFNVLVAKAGFGSDSKFLDVGCGTGKVLLYASIGYGVKLAKGVEMSEYRVQTARSVMELVGRKVVEVKPFC